MSELADLVPDGHVLRLAASYDWLPAEQCTVPDRCITKQCQQCGRSVHWDPSAAIPLLGPEWILCDICLEEAGEEVSEDAG